MKPERKIRRPSVSGYFYPSDQKALREQIERSFKSPAGPGELPKLNKLGKREIIVLIAPHAGYIYSGHVAAYGYASLAEDGKPELIVLLGPNHTGFGSGVSLMDRGVWQTPLGNVEVDEKVAENIAESSRIVTVDALAHAKEHSLEVQLPFLKYTLDDFKIIPIIMMMQDLNTSREIGKAVAAAVEDRNVVIVASTDLTHYESQIHANKKDNAVINAVLSLDEEKLIDTVYRMDVSMCGKGPVAAAIYIAKTLGASKAELLKYDTSGSVTDDFSQVVGYASIKITL